jgi:hypothetical protein
MIITAKAIAKTALVVWAVSQAAFALNAPYLISATALSDSSVSLSWRNNDAGTVGYILQRKDSTETIYHFLDSVNTATQITYTDLKNLRPSTLYTYQVIGYDATVLSDTSNSVQVTTPARIVTFKQPVLSLSAWDFETSTNSLDITVHDSSDCEIGYRIYREENFSSSFNLMYQSISANPRNFDSIFWSDTTVSPNQWYTYRAEVYKSDSTLVSLQSSSYTLHSVPQAQSVLFQKLSDFPISVQSTAGSWSALTGDSIILKETNSPSGTPFTVINVSDPANPVFAGYIDSAAAKAYPLRTLVPVILQYGAFNTWQRKTVVICKDMMLVALQPSLAQLQLQLYRIAGGGSFLAFVASLSYSELWYNTELTSLIMLNDTLTAVRYKKYYTLSTKPTVYSYFQPVFLSSSALVPCSTNMFYSYNINQPGDTHEYVVSYFHGCYNDNILMSACTIVNPYEKFFINNVSNSSLNRTAVLPGTQFWNNYANGFSTGHYLSPTVNLCTNGPHVWNGATAVATELFATDVRDVRGYQTALANGAVYRDNVHLQNTLQNILLDTLNKRVYLVFTTNLSVLRYQSSAGIIADPKKPAPARGLTILRGPVTSSITIVLPRNSRSADLCFYDLSGRVIDRMTGVTANAVLWRPTTKTMSCYIVMVKSGQEKYTAKFMVR